MNIRRGKDSQIFSEPEANNCFGTITRVIIRDKQEPSIKVNFVCLKEEAIEIILNSDRISRKQSQKKMTISPAERR